MRSCWMEWMANRMKAMKAFRVNALFTFRPCQMLHVTCLDVVWRHHHSKSLHFFFICHTQPNSPTAYSNAMLPHGGRDNSIKNNICISDDNFKNRFTGKCNEQIIKQKAEKCTKENEPSISAICFMRASTSSIRPPEFHLTDDKKKRVECDRLRQCYLIATASAQFIFVSRYPIPEE